jgi:NlpC/P60 family putative phage cell wall peptidase
LIVARAQRGVSEANDALQTRERHGLCGWNGPGSAAHRYRAAPRPGHEVNMYITRSLIVAETRAWIGTPYRHQASLKGVGCDCLGLVRGVWRMVVGDEPERAPPYAPDWAEAASGEPLAEAAARHLVAVDRDAFSVGDVLLFRWRSHLPAKHAAIVTAPDRMVHAHDGAAVAEVALAPWWRRRIAYAFRFPGVA